VSLQGLPILIINFTYFKNQ